MGNLLYITVKMCLYSLKQDFTEYMVSLSEPETLTVTVQRFCRKIPTEFNKLSRYGRLFSVMFFYMYNLI